MKSIDWSDRVAADFRERILLEPDSPILAVKANRDRYTLSTQRSYAGLPYLGSQTSEDALTWNVFRSLQKAGRLDILCNELGIGEPRAMLLWALATEVDDTNAYLQYVVGMLIRKFDGILAGQITEPDVVMLGSRGVAVIECKLGESRKPLSHLWEGSLGSVQKRLTIYRQAEPNLISKDVTLAQITCIYQLVRIAFYAAQVAGHFSTTPVVVSLVNDMNWHVKIPGLDRSPARLWEFFLEAVTLPTVKGKTLTWQRISTLVTEGGLDTLADYLSTHPCLK